MSDLNTLATAKRQRDEATARYLSQLAILLNRSLDLDGISFSPSSDRSWPALTISAEHAEKLLSKLDEAARDQGAAYAVDANDEDDGPY